MSDPSTDTSASRPKGMYTLNDWVRADNLPAPRRDQLKQRIRALPKPAAAVQKLLSQEFIDNASSPELSTVVMSEPAVAAKVIAAVNSSLYKLSSPVNSIGQAITFLGVNQVRAICIQRMLSACFTSTDPRVGRALDMVWQANSAANLLLPKLAQGFRLTDPAALTSRVILSFVGQLGVAALMTPSSLSTWIRLDRCLRYRMEEQFIGLNATELGGLVLQNWGIPEEMVNAVGGIDRVLVTPADGLSTEHALPNAVGFLCVWMAEQLTRGLGSAATSPWSPVDKQAPELQAWLSYMALPGMEEGIARLDGEGMQQLFVQIRAGQAS